MPTETSPDSTVLRVQQVLEQAILEGRYGPGDRIRENAVAAELNVSRAPVREACRMLERVGLVRILPNQGTVVASLTLNEVVQLFDIRTALGRLAGERAAASISDESLRILRKLIADMDIAAADRDSHRYIGLNLDFHACLYEATGNKRLAEYDSAIGKELRSYRRVGLAHGGGLAVSNQEHRTILACIERGACEEAGMHLAQHISNGRDRFLRAMSAEGLLIVDQRGLAQGPEKALS